MLLYNKEVAALGCVCLVAYWILQRYVKPTKNSRLPVPPFVPLTEAELNSTPVESMTKALRDHGSIVEIVRNGRRELITSDEHTRRILTDKSAFSFELGMAETFGLGWILQLHGGSFFRDMDSVVRGFLTRRFDRIVPRVWPIFERGASDFVDDARSHKPVDVLPFLQSTMADVTIEIFLGPKYKTPEYSKCVISVATNIAELLGLSNTQSFLARKLPRVWLIYRWAKIVLIRIPMDLGVNFAWSLWTDISQESSQKTEDTTIVSYLVRKYKSETGTLSLASKLWIMVLVMTILFSSVHQTVTIMVWVTYHLALRPDCQASLRDEINSLPELGETGYKRPNMGYSDLRKAIKADSFIREVLRMKGDSVNVVRSSIRDVELGGYTIPKGSVIFPVTHLSYRSPEYTEDPDEFDETRWVGTRKTAATVGPGYLAFGLGRWACPGRFLAVNEIKSWILALVKCSKFELEGGKYQVIDPCNITGVPPLGRLILERSTEE